MKHILLIAVLLAALSCRSHEEAVQVRFDDKASSIAEFVDKIQLIPLETDSVHILGENPELLIADTSFVVSDWQNGNIFRYSLQGHFLNQIGQRGNGPFEFLSIDGLSYEDSVVTVFSYPDKKLRYGLDGKQILECRIGDLGMFSFSYGDKALTYYGYGAGVDYRAAILDSTGVTTRFLKDPNSNKVFNFMPLTPPIAKSNGVFLLDPFNTTVYEFDNNDIKPHISFNLRPYAVDDSYYKFDNPAEAAGYLFSQDYAYINKYAEGTHIKVVEIILNKQGVGKPYNGICYDGNWHWFSFGDFNSMGLSFKTVSSDDIVYLLFSPEDIDKFPEELKEFVINKDCLQDLAADSNYVLAKLYLRTH